jgi:hypothetical protein
VGFKTSEKIDVFVYFKQIHRTPDPEICYAAEESKGILTEKEVDPQTFGTETELPVHEIATEELALVEEKSDATTSLVPSEHQIEIEIAKESSVVPQSTTESVAVPDEKVSQEVETSAEPSDKDITGEVYFVCTIAHCTNFLVFLIQIGLVLTRSAHGYVYSCTVLGPHRFC